ncbi:MAG: DNA damage-inducible protein D [bacterium]
MDRELIQSLAKDFESYVIEIDGVECWFARDLQTPLGYDRWENFYNVVQKAKIACENAGNIVDDHFRDVTKMVDIGSQTTREIDDIILTRYACYLIAQNGDPRKDEIAFAQTYFALQTRKQELLEERLRLAERLRAREKLVTSETELSKLIYERGVDESGFGRIRSKGDAAMFGGYNTRQMKYRLSIPQNRPLADFLPTVTITAKNLATEITNYNVQQQNLQGEPRITNEHVKNNAAIRKTLIERGIKPENLPHEEDIKKLERRLDSENKKSLKQVKKLKRPKRKS